ncbi:hypothetical protein [Caballeronia sp. AZ7_KS35]|uniref:hypothetical protein n=1 Tax=Caballeronia sp. AZ7_KS35 TaxID=2921762 RepID=UPI002027C1FE|nr:hypothetical protein [Caballeronia sp. AZ7_KS35]
MLQNGNGVKGCYEFIETFARGAKLFVEPDKIRRPGSYLVLDDGQREFSGGHGITGLLLRFYFDTIRI